MKGLFNSSVHFRRALGHLIFSSHFYIITLFGNAVIITFSLIFYLIELSTNPSVNSFLDAVWWGFATATTVGYGDIIPVTVAGKVIGIALMLTGTALFATYTALFAQTILEDEFLRLAAKPKKGKSGHQDDFLAELKKHRDWIDRQIDHHQNH